MYICFCVSFCLSQKKNTQKHSLGTTRSLHIAATVLACLHGKEDGKIAICKTYKRSERIAHTRQSYISYCHNSPACVLLYMAHWLNENCFLFFYTDRRRRRRRCVSSRKWIEARQRDHLRSYVNRPIIPRAVRRWFLFMRTMVWWRRKKSSEETSLAKNEGGINFAFLGLWETAQTSFK